MSTEEKDDDKNIFSTAQLYSHDECQAKLEELEIDRRDLEIAKKALLDATETDDDRVRNLCFEALKKLGDNK